MTASAYINTLVKDEFRLPMAKYLYPNHFKENEGNVGWNEIKNRLHKLGNITPFGFDENPFELMTIVNRMAKSKSMPANLRNRFYTYKHRIINKCLSEHRVTEVYDEGNVYGIIIDGKYKYHQLKNSYPKGLRCNGTRQSTVTGISEEFDIVVFRKFMVNAIKFLGGK